MLHFTGSQRVRPYLAPEQQKQKHHTDKYVPQTEPVSLLVFFFFNTTVNTIIKNKGVEVNNVYQVSVLFLQCLISYRFSNKSNFKTSIFSIIKETIV